MYKLILLLLIVSSTSAFGQTYDEYVDYEESLDFKHSSGRILVSTQKLTFAHKQIVTQDLDEGAVYTYPVVQRSRDGKYFISYDAFHQRTEVWIVQPSGGRILRIWSSPEPHSYGRAIYVRSNQAKRRVITRN